MVYKLPIWTLTVIAILYISKTSCQTYADIVKKPQYNKQFEIALEAVFGIGVKLQALLEGKDAKENFLISPISVTAVLGQLLLGAEGKFRDQLYELLLPNQEEHKNTNLHFYNDKTNETYVLPYSQFHLQMYSLMKHLEKNLFGNRKLFKLNQKNAIFYQKTLSLQERFKSNSLMFYDADLVPVNFREDAVGAQKLLNTWAATQTNGVIQTIFSLPPLPDTTAIFLNAIYFLAEWEVPFSELLNKNESFAISDNETVEVTYMLGPQDHILYTENEQFKMIALPYKNNELEMFMMLPSKDSPYKYDINKFAQSLKSEDVVKAIDTSKYRNVIVKLPKLSLSSSVSILNSLQKYKAFKDSESSKNETQMTTNELEVLDKKLDTYNNFTAKEYPAIYLSGAIKGANLRVDDVVQEMIFSINEKGTEAAAVSFSSVYYNGGQKIFIANRPFLFFIRHNTTTATLFWGTIANPAHKIT